MPDEQPPSTVGASSAEGSIAQQEQSLAGLSDHTGNQLSRAGSQKGDDASNALSDKSIILDTDSEDGDSNAEASEEGLVQDYSPVEKHFIDATANKPDFSFEWWGVEYEAFADLYRDRLAAIVKSEGVKVAPSQATPAIPEGPLPMAGLAKADHEYIMSMITDWEKNQVINMLPKIHICRFDPPNLDKEEDEKRRSFVYALRRDRLGWEKASWPPYRVDRLFRNITYELAKGTGPPSDVFSKALPGLRPHPTG